MAKIIKVYNRESEAYAAYQRETLEEAQPEPEETEVVEEEAEEPLPDPAEVLAEARAEAEKKIREAYAEGYRRGEEKGREEFLAKVGEAGEVFRQAAENIEDTHHTYLSTLVPQVASLVGSIAERILHRESRTDDELIQRTARKALEAMIDRQRIVIHVHPEDLDHLRSHKPELIEEFEGIERFRIEASENVRRGGCIVESDTMAVDATIDSQLRHILDAMLE